MHVEWKIGLAKKLGPYQTLGYLLVYYSCQTCQYITNKLFFFSTWTYFSTISQITFWNKISGSILL